MKRHEIISSLLDQLMSNGIAAYAVTADGAEHMLLSVSGSDGATFYRTSDAKVLVGSEIIAIDFSGGL